MEKLVIVAVALGIIILFSVISVLILTWVLNTLLPLFGVKAAATWLHGLALWLLLGALGSRVRRG